MSKKYKGTLKGVAQVTIARNNHQMVTIEICDGNQQKIICEVRMTPASFGEAITGWARRPAILYFNMDYDPEEQPINE